MRVNLEWLGDWVDAGLDGEALAAEFTAAGLEVDSVTPAAGDFDGVVVARILRVEPHPDADRLRLCDVYDGVAQLRIVCGAANVVAGRCAALARVGARLPDGRVVSAAKVRGQHSEGMLCSGDELGIDDAHDGILLFDNDAPAGESLRDYLRLDDAVLDIDLTPNRGDCFSVRGLAREIAARRERPLHDPAWPLAPCEHDETLPVRLAAPQACPRFAGRVIRGLRTDALTPVWIQERLRRAGVRCISPVVDVTNYVMLELGQPLHAYDLGSLQGGIVVRLASENEKLTLLDEREIDLTPDVLVIADERRAVGLAGIMGGAHTAVRADTRDVFLEGAHFAPAAIAGRARAFGLHTDASVRFERGVDPELPAIAVERATALLLQIAGGKSGPMEVAESSAHLPASSDIHLRHQQAEAVLGVALGADTIAAVLRRLGMEVTAAAGGWQVRPPGHRFDIAIEEDLIEEVGRMVGYDNIPAVPGLGAVHPGTATETRLGEDRIADTLVARGYTEVVTYSFIDESLQRAVMPEGESVRLRNPIASDMGVMRRSLWPGLLSVARQNLSRQQHRLRLFEIGRQFEPGEGGRVVETNMLAGLAIGARHPEHWEGSGDAVDFFDIKADVEALIAATGRSDDLRFQAAEHPALHPGQCARIFAGDEPAGWLGRIHPGLARELDVGSGTILFALETEATFASRVPSFRAISKFPSVRRDLAVVVDESVTAADLVDRTKQAGGDLLKSTFVFDIYRGKGIDSSRKSVALGLILQDASRTLTDADADRIVQSVTRLLQSELGATIRT